MTETRSNEIHCPTCKASVSAGGRHFPFCSDRCRMVDLGQWLEGNYRIPSGPPEEDEEAADPAAPTPASLDDGVEG